MSYPRIEDNDFSENLLKRKEFYSLRNDPERNFRDPPGEPHDPFIGKYLKIHSHQLFIRNFLNPNTSYKRLLLMHSTGCHAINTPILMNDGSIKLVQDVKIGDKLMGDDSTPREVIELKTGCEKMYKVIPEFGDSFICNESHILSIKMINSIDDPQTRTRSNIINVSIKDFLKRSDMFSARLYRVPVEFPEKKTQINPYTTGYVMGVGNPLSIPDEYKINSRLNRIKLLNGLIFGNGGYRFISKCKKFIEDIVYICRSLGFYICMLSNFDYYFTNVPSNILETNGKHRILEGSEVKFVLEELPPDNYYGFLIDKNSLYLLGDFTVTHNSGKTLGAISIAQDFIKVYRRMYQSMSIKLQGGKRNYAEIDRSTPTIFVLGFGGTQAAFKRELLRHPELGFISLSEKEELLKRQKIADAGLPDDVRSLKEYYNHLKKRITNKTKDGFYKFFGYQEFVNRLFLSDEIKLTDLEAIAIQKLRAGENITLEDIVHEYIENGKIQVNYQLLEQFKDSLLICDEIHNTYNMNMKNNYGVAIQFVLDSIPSLRAVFMSATPVNNSPTEIVEVLNYLIKTDKKITKKEFFINNRTLHPGKLEQIGEMSKGRVSFLQDINIKYFPKRIFMGEVDKLPREVDGAIEIPYLKFYKCPMSILHQNTYNHYLKNIAAENGKSKELETEYISVKAKSNPVKSNVHQRKEYSAEWM